MHLLAGVDAAGLRVGDVMEDEDLLNVALWEERANKQWCHSAVFRLGLESLHEDRKQGCGLFGVSHTRTYEMIGWKVCHPLW